MKKDYYLLLRGTIVFNGDESSNQYGKFELLGIYSENNTLKDAYETEKGRLEKEFLDFREIIDKESVFFRRETYDKLYIYHFNEEENVWNYDIEADDLFI